MRRREICNFIKGLLRYRIKLAHNRAKRHAKHKIRAVRAVPAGAFPVYASCGFKVMLISVINERRELWVGDNDNIASMSAVSAVRPAFGDECLTPKRHTTGAAIATLDIDMA